MRDPAILKQMDEISEELEASVDNETHGAAMYQLFARDAYRRAQVFKDAGDLTSYQVWMKTASDDYFAARFVMNVWGDENQCYA